VVGVLQGKRRGNFCTPHTREGARPKRKRGLYALEKKIQYEGNYREKEGQAKKQVLVALVRRCCPGEKPLGEVSEEEW